MLDGYGYVFFYSCKLSSESLMMTIINLFYTGTQMFAEKYKIGKKTTDIALQILNLDKTEVVTIDVISNQEFTEVGI